MTILIIHYHLRPGGVTRVIESQVQVLRAQGHQVIVASSGPLTDWDCQHLIIPELDYQKKGTIPISLLLNTPADFWIIHNPTLGLNSAYPDLIEAAAYSGPKILMQIHDFAEDGRPENYQLLKTRKKIYPLASHIHYASVNRRDYQSLLKAKIPASRCHLLPNAIHPPALSATSSVEPLIFYPVRGIRRKNLGELCLLAAHAPEGTRFATALGAGPEESPLLHQDWVDFAKKEKLPIEFAIAEQDPACFKSYLERASHLITTSISEGFGLTFLDPAFINKPLIGRDLPDITKDFIPYGTLYQSIPIPLKHLPSLKRLFLEGLQRTRTAYGHPLSQKQLHDVWRAFSKNECVDFGNLPEALQRHLITSICLPELRHWISHALKKPAGSIDTSAWSLPTYAKNLTHILQQIQANGPLDWLPPHKILHEFLKPHKFHFLKSQI